jgi:hypothetical protein
MCLTVERGRAPPHVPLIFDPSSPILRKATPRVPRRIHVAPLHSASHRAFRDPRRILEGDPSNRETDLPSRPCVPCRTLRPAIDDEPCALHRTPHPATRATPCVPRLALRCATHTAPHISLIAWTQVHSSIAHIRPLVLSDRLRKLTKKTGQLTTTHIFYSHPSRSEINRPL